MSEGMNRVTLLGNLGADPELRYTSSGMPLLTMRLATNESYLDKNREVQERTEWHNLVVWGARAEALGRVLVKGDCVLIEGSLRTTSYEKDGVKRSRTEVVVREFRFTGRQKPLAPQPDDAAPPPDTPRVGDTARPPEGARAGRNGSAPRPTPMLEELPY